MGKLDRDPKHLGLCEWGRVGRICPRKFGPYIWYAHIVFVCETDRVVNNTV